MATLLPNNNKTAGGGGYKISWLEEEETRGCQQWGYLTYLIMRGYARRINNNNNNVELVIRGSWCWFGGGELKSTLFWSLLLLMKQMMGSVVAVRVEQEIGPSSPSSSRMLTHHPCLLAITNIIQLDFYLPSHLLYASSNGGSERTKFVRVCRTRK